MKTLFNGKYSQVQFTFINDSATPRTRTIFNAMNSYLPTNVANIPSSPTIKPNFYVEGSTEYWQFLRDAAEKPKFVRNIRMVSDAASYSILENAAPIVWTDASGLQYVKHVQPILNISAYQPQSYIADLPFKGDEYVIDTNTYMAFTFPATSVFTFIVTYFDVDLYDLITGRQQNVCDLFDACDRQFMEEISYVSEEWIEQQSTTNNKTPFLWQRKQIQ